MSSEKRVFMELGDGSEFESSKSKEQEPKKELQKEAQDNIKDGVMDAATDKLLEGVEMMEIAGGMVNITMPLAMFNILSMFFKKLENELDIGAER